MIRNGGATNEVGRLPELPCTPRERSLDGHDLASNPRMTARAVARADGEGTATGSQRFERPALQLCAS